MIFKQFITYGGWVVSIAVGAVLFLQFIQSPVQAVKDRITAAESTNEVQNQIIINVQGSMQEIKDNVKWIRDNMVQK